MNYAEQLEMEAYDLARYQLIRTLTGTPAEERLDGYLARLDLIHGEAMAAAAEWRTPIRPGTKGRELTAADVSTVAVIPAAGSLIAEAKGEDA